MRKLLPLLALALAVPIMASAQTQTWAFSRVFPDSSQRKAHGQTHGIVVDREGKVWIQPNNAANGDSVFVPALGRRVISNAIYIFNANGTPAAFSPLLILQYPNGSRDTLGGFLGRNSTGALAWETRSGRGLAMDNQGNIVAAHFNSIFKINATTGAGISRVLNASLNGTAANGLSGPAVDRTGRVYATGVFPGDAIVIYNADMTFRETIAPLDEGFSRVTGVSATGDTLYHFPYDKKAVYRYKRPDEFSAFNPKPDTLLRGMAVESFTTHPTTRQLWMGAGSLNDLPTPPYFRNRWYAFNANDLTMPFPPRRDSIVWNGTKSDGTPSDGRPRAIAFTQNGMTAYVGQFSNVGGELFGVRRYSRITVGIDAYGRWVPDDVLVSVGPNPTRGTTTVRYQGLAGVSVRIELYDVAGRLVQTLVDGVQAGGEQTTTFDTSGMAAGVYYVRYSADGAVVTRPVSVVR